MMTRLLGIVLLAAASAIAQGQASRSMFPWWDSPVVRDLNLSEDQARQIRTALREQRSHLIDLRAAVEKAEGDVEDLFNEDAVDQKRTAEAIEKLVQARTDLTRVFSMLSLKLRAVLTPQQWRELPAAPPATAAATDARAWPAAGFATVAATRSASPSCSAICHPAQASRSGSRRRSCRVR